MSTIIQPNETIDSAVEPAFDLVEMLLAEQHSMTAVEQFSRFHQELHATSAGEPAQAKYYRSLLPATAPAPGEQYAFDVDLDACSGCKACVVACHSLNGLEDDETWRRVGTVTIGKPESARVQHVTTACHHCADPGCLNGCPVKAYEKDPQTGIVRHLDDQCIGCKYCTMMCPYEVPRYSDRLGIVRKCDMCHQRLSVGEAPACVQSCPNEAISIRVVSDQRQWHESPERYAPGAPLSSITQPTTRYRSEHVELVEQGLPQDSGIDELAESHWPLAAMLVATQISVGMLLIERVISFAGDFGIVELSQSFLRINSTVALVAAVIGMAIAPLHLGQPLRAWRVFLGLRTSWLSREAIVLGKFVGVLAIAVSLLWLPLIDHRLPLAFSQRLPEHTTVELLAELVLWASLALGAAGLYCSAMIYVATQRPLWCRSRTLTAFFGTAFIGGLAGVVATLLWTGGAIPLVGGLAAVFVTAMISKVAWEWRRSLGPRRAADSPLQRRSRTLVRTRLNGVRWLRLAAAAISSVAALTILLTMDRSLELATASAVISLAALVAGEFAERLLYFSGVVYDRMPGMMR